MDGTIFLDVNVFMYAAGKPHAYKNPCLHILKDVETQALAAVVNTETFQELLYRYSHIGVAEKGVQLCNDILKYPITILPITKADIELAIELFEQHKDAGVKPRDAIHAATLKNNNLTQLISADKDFDSFDFLTRIDPKDYIPQSE
jgi:predicted nucleic acid-binding protein